MIGAVHFLSDEHVMLPSTRLLISPVIILKIAVTVPLSDSLHDILNQVCAVVTGYRSNIEDFAQCIQVACRY